MQFVSTLLVIAAVISSGLAYKFSLSKFDDIKVTNSNGVIQCDKVECPRETVRCHVSKRNLDENPFKINREIICYGTNGKILQRKSWSEESRGNHKVNVQIDMYDDGRTAVMNEGNSVGFNQGFFESMTSMVQQIGTYVQDLFLHPFH